MHRRSLAPCVLIAVCLADAFSAQAAERPTEGFPLWPGDAPAAKGKAETDIPTLTPFWADPAKATGAAIIVCPGGGYNVLAPHEGAAYARWLADLGITAFVLKYRLVKDGYHLPEITGDAARAVRLVRSSAADWQLDPQRIGIIGSSAGGHLSANLMTQCDSGRPDAEDKVERASSRPDAVILCYAFILFDRNDKPERQTKFLGPNPSQEQVRKFSPALNVTKDCPPCFIWQTVEDKSVPPENATVLAEALRISSVPFDLHLYQKGRHGIGLGSKDYDPAQTHPWTKDCAFWLGEQGFLKTK